MVHGYTDDDSLLYRNELPAIVFGDHTKIFKFVEQPFVLGADGVKVFTVAGDLIPKFLYYCALSLLIPDAGYSRHFKFLRETKVSIPPYSQQIEIFQYLDQKTTQIDSLIQKLEQKIELLKEYRTSLISQCVIKGLDPNAEMKDSGIDWVGKIPSHWDNRRIRFFSNFRLSNIDRKFRTNEVRVKVSHYPDVYYNENISKETELPAGSCSKQQLKEFQLMEGDILITKDSESPEDIGIPCFITEDIENSVCGYHLGQYRIHSPLVPSFVFRSLQSTYTQAYFEVNANGVTRFGLRTDTLTGLSLPIPPKSEQVQIAQYLDQKTIQIDSLIEKLKKKIEFLKEYRQSLISNVVTGKIRITGQTE